jgi:transposase
MDQGSSALDLAQVLQRLARVETHVATQQATIEAQQATLAEQQQIIAQQRATIAAQHEALTVAREQITLLKKALFGPKRERHLAAPDQQLLFETAHVEPAPAIPAPVPRPPKGPRQRRRKFVFPEFLPVVRHEHKLDNAECACGGCGATRTVINTLVTRQIEIERAKAFIEEHVRYTYACGQCRDGSQMQTTTKPPTPLEKSPFGASVLAWLISAKFERHLPTYRHQEMLLEPLGLWLSRPLLAKLLRGSAQVLRPLAACLLREILASVVIQADETPVKYLGHERGKSSTGYLFGYAGDAEHRCLFYDYRASRSRAGPAEILADYPGVLLSDGFSGYEALVQESQGRLRAAACWMHARREFDEARATTSHPLVEETLARIRLLYDLEDRAKALAHEERRALREREAGPLVERIFSSLEAEAGQHRPSSPLAKAVQYALNRRVALSRFLDDGRIELDTGLLERSLRGPALGRKNYLFFGSLGGGHTAATLYSVVQSAKLYQLDVTAYLTDVLRRLAALLPTDTSAMRELLPDRWALAHPEHILQARQQESLAALEKRRHRRAARRLATSGDVD